MAKSRPPDVIRYYTNGNKKQEEWYINGACESTDDFPCVVRYYMTGEIKEKTWGKNGFMHRINFPAHITYHKNGKEENEAWYINGEYCRPSGESDHTVYDQNGFISSKHWHKNEFTIGYHVFRHEDGRTIEEENWRKNDEPHRDNEPATLFYNKNGEMIRQEWWVNGKFIRECSHLK